MPHNYRLMALLVGCLLTAAVIAERGCALFGPPPPAGPPPKYIFEKAEEGFVGERSAIPIPVENDLFAEVHLEIDGVPCTSQTTRLPSGKQVSVRGSVRPGDHLELGRHVESLGLGLACRSTNQKGWAVVAEKFFGGSGTPIPGQPDRLIREFDGQWLIPTLTGEFDLVVLGTVTETGRIIPIRPAAAFPVVVE